VCISLARPGSTLTVWQSLLTVKVSSCISPEVIGIQFIFLHYDHLKTRLHLLGCTAKNHEGPVRSELGCVVIRPICETGTLVPEYGSERLLRAHYLPFVSLFCELPVFFPPSLLMRTQ